MSFRSLLLAAPLVLSACAGAVISSNQKNAAADALAQLRIVSQSAQLGAFSSPRSFDIAAPYYAQAIAGFESAMPAAKDSGLGDRTEEREKLRQSVSGCIEAIELTAELHRTSGLTDKPEDFGVLTACESTARAMGRSA